ncbi:MAG: hypothetical protein WC692_04560 [Erythrobacter sp.]
MRIAAILLALALAACASGPDPRDRYARLLTPVANPSKVVAAELAFARAAQEKGQWTAFRQFATEDAVMFVPEPVNAQEWLRKQADPAQAVAWQPHEVWSSCDGSLAVTRGAWQRPGGTFGYFTTVWQRDSKTGEYRWVMDQGDALTTPLIEPEFIATTIASCEGAPSPLLFPLADGSASFSGRSRDATLDWRVAVLPDKSRVVTLSYWDGRAWQSPVRVLVKP